MADVRTQRVRLASPVRIDRDGADRLTTTIRGTPLLI
jgi:hypothetical protein